MRSLWPLIMLFACGVAMIDAGRGYGGRGRSGPRSSVAMSYNASCINPNSEPGRCVLVQECKLVLTVLRKETLTSDDVAFLYSSECGKQQGKSLVCCPGYSIASGGGLPEDSIANRVDQGQGHGVTGDGQASKPAAAADDRWNLLPQPGDCGTQPSYQLFGENVTKLDEQPWTALVHYGNKPYEFTFECGGALISERYVLTAAHCVTDRNKWSNLTIRLGEWDTESTVDCVSIGDFSEFYCADPAVDIPVEKVIVHEQYARHHRPQLNDIALLRLAEPVSTSSWVRPICLPERAVAVKATEDADQVFTLAGWGNNGCGNTSRYKVRSKLTALNQDQCRNNLPAGFRRANAYLCTVPVNEGDKCHADSGGAVTSTRQVSGVGVVHEVAGILNYMKECNSTKPIGIFTNVGQYTDWIVSKLEQ